MGHLDLTSLFNCASISCTFSDIIKLCVRCSLSKLPLPVKPLVWCTNTRKFDLRWVIDIDFRSASELFSQPLTIDLLTVIGIALCWGRLLLNSYDYTAAKIVHRPASMATRLKTYFVDVVVGGGDSSFPVATLDRTVNSHATANSRSHSLV